MLADNRVGDPLVELPASVVEGRSLIALEVAGDAMAPTIREGDVVVVDCSTQPLREAVYVLVIGDVPVVRRIGMKPAGGCVAICDNPRYGSEDVDRAALQVLGRVVWKGGKL
jgi:phage repressor protein C with HTH and peptisase S24 domain